MELIKPGTKFPFTRYRKIAFLISTVVNLAVVLALFIKGPNLGVDFAGGTIIQVKFNQKVTIPEIRKALDKVEPRRRCDFRISGDPRRQTNIFIPLGKGTQ